MSFACSGSSLQGSTSGSCVFGNCLAPILQFKTATSGVATFAGSSTCNVTFVVKVNGNVVAEFLQGQTVSTSLSSEQYVEVFARLPATISACTADAYVCYSGQISGNIPPSSSQSVNIDLVLILVAIVVIVSIFLFFR